MISPRRICLVSHIALNLWLFRIPLAQQLAEEGWSVTLIAPEGPHMPKLIKSAHDICQTLQTRRDGVADCVTVRPWQLRRGSLAPGAALRGSRELAAILAEERPDLVHTFTHQPNILARLAMGRVKRATKKRPVLVNSVTGLGSCFLGKGPRGVALRMFFYQLYARTASRAHGVLFQNEDDRLYFESRNLTGSAKTGCIRGSGVDTSRFRPATGTTQTAPDCAHPWASSQPITVPTPREEAERGLLRLRHQLIDAVRRVKQRIKGLLLLHGAAEPPELATGAATPWPPWNRSTWSRRPPTPSTAIFAN